MAGEEDQFEVLKRHRELLDVINWGIEVEVELQTNKALRALMENWHLRARAMLLELCDLDIHGSDFTQRARSCIGEVKRYRESIDALVLVVRNGRARTRDIEQSEQRS